VVNLNEEVFWGLRNYYNIIADTEFWKSMFNTLALMVMSLGIGIPSALILASMINSLGKGKSVFKIGFFLPNLTSIVIVIIVMKLIFNSSDKGLANMLLSIFGINPVEWFVDPRISKLTVVLGGLWNGIGYTTLLFMAGLQVISIQLYEAADMDGASSIQKFKFITLPGVKNTTLFILVTGVIGGFQRFQDVYILSGNGWRIDKNLQTAMLYVFNKNFSASAHMNTGMAMAGGMVLGFIMFVVIAILNKYTGISKSTRLS
jgi:ABC-type sugar transport system permease subunit